MLPANLKEARTAGHRCDIFLEMPPAIVKNATTRRLFGVCAPPGQSPVASVRGPREIPRTMGPGSITRWIEDLRRGEADAAQGLWDAYFQQLVRLAETRLHGVAGKAADAEDVALSAFKSFWLGV